MHGLVTNLIYKSRAPTKYKYHKSLLTEHNQNNMFLCIYTCDLKVNLINIIFNIRFHTSDRKKSL